MKAGASSGAMIRNYKLPCPKTEFLEPSAGARTGGLAKIACITHLFSNENNWPGSCEGFRMILLVTASERALECSAALTRATGEEVLVAESLVRATTLLRVECYLAVVLDQNLLEARPHEAGDHVRAHGQRHPRTDQFRNQWNGASGAGRPGGGAAPAARRSGGTASGDGQTAGELNGTVTALLLSTELALEDRSLPPAAAEKLRSVKELVKRLRQQLESAIPTDEAKQRAAGA